MLLFLAQEASITTASHLTLTPNTCFLPLLLAESTEMAAQRPSGSPHLLVPSAHSQKKEKTKIRAPPHCPAPGFSFTCIASPLLNCSLRKNERKRPKRQLGNPPSIGFPPHEASRLLLLQWLGKRTSLWLSTSPAPPVNYSHKLLTRKGYLQLGCNTNRWQWDASAPPFTYSIPPPIQSSGSGLELPGRVKGRISARGLLDGDQGGWRKPARIVTILWIHRQLPRQGGSQNAVLPKKPENQTK